MASEGLVGQRFDLAATLAGRAVEERQPLLMSAGDNPDRPSHLASVIDAGPTMVLPLQGTQDVRGVLNLIRLRGRRPFSAHDLAMAAGFANHASVALELADSRSAEQKVVLLEDRERIARDLHDHVIQELFAIGLSLESVAALLGPNVEVAQRIQQRVEDIDRTIRRIRTSIFALRGPLNLAADGLRQRILEIAGDLTPALGFPPHISFAGLVDLGVSAEMADDAAAVIREALTNVAKHAHATSTTVDLGVAAREVSLTVSDNGIGIGQPTRSSGVANLKARAEKYGGTCEVTPGHAGGTTVTWKAPIT
jgi:signal transduction histidine kinase